MSNTCQFCNKTFPSEKNLKIHQRTAKYCIKIQSNNDYEEKVLNFSCEFCNKDFSHKHILNNHYNSCKQKMVVEKERQMKDLLDEKDRQMKNLLDEKDRIIDEKERLLVEKDRYMKECLALKDKQLRDFSENKDERFVEMKEQIDKLQNSILEIAKSNTQYITNNTNNDNSNNIIVNNNIRLNINDIEKMNKMVEEHLTDNVLVGGQKGIARMVKDNFLTGPNGESLYKCVDASRHIFEYTNEHGYVERDVKAHKLKNTLVNGNLCERVTNLGLQLWTRPDGSTDETRYGVYGDKVLEVSKMSYDDSKFRTELSAITS